MSIFEVLELFFKVIIKMFMINFPFLILAIILIMFTCALITRITKNKTWLKELKDNYIR